MLDPLSKTSLLELSKLLDGKQKWKLSPASKERMRASAGVVSKLASQKAAIYGVNTGFGRLKNVRIPEKKLQVLQENILRSHAAGIGDFASPSVVRRLLLLRVLSLGKGYSGIRPEIVERHLTYLERGLIPAIPLLGSVGASGDLAPLAHLGLTFMGEGFFIENNKRVPAEKILKREKLKPFKLEAKEGLSLINGTQFSLALALEAFESLVRLLPWIETSLAMSVEAHMGSRVPFSKDLNSLKPHRHQQDFAAKIFQMLSGSDHMDAHKDCDRVQDPYSFRCAPQVMGPALSLVETAARLLEDELNSVTDNPIVFTKENSLLSGGHFHAQSVSMAADVLAISVATIGNLIERRIDQLVSPLTSESTAFLADDPGVESGLMIVQTAVAALASENKTLSHPASSDTIPTNGNQEDHVSMAPWAARKLLQMVNNLRRIVAAEIVCASRGLRLQRERYKAKFSHDVEAKWRELIKQHPNLNAKGDIIFSELWREVETKISSS